MHMVHAFEHIYKIQLKNKRKYKKKIDEIGALH
jgi:hypothetical protein